MNTPLTRLLCLCTVLLVIANLSYAQNKPTQNILHGPPANITIDGGLKDWGDSLRYHNDDKKINYSLANDKENLYMAIRLNDYADQVKVLNAGLTLSIDTKGGKKERFSITFPVGEQGGLTRFGLPRQGNADSILQERDELIQGRLTKLRGIKVTGFPDIEGTQITTSNTYGIKTAIDYDKDGYLVLEAAIPLKFFHADDPAKTEWGFNFKINGITRPSEGNHPDTDKEGLTRGGPGGGMGGGRGGRGGGGRGGRGGQHNDGEGQQADHSEMSKSVDFWEKFYLAK